MTDDLNSWFRHRPKWLQYAANALLTKGRLSDEEVDAFLDKCLLEVDADNATEGTSFPADAFAIQSVSSLRLGTIGNVRGINALAPRSPLDFGPDNLAVVYGGNGSGKSGYVRILKHVCGARNTGALHPNVFSDDETAQSADITYEQDEQERRVPWTISDGIQTDLRAVDIFDSDCGRMYLESESEVTYEPPALLFFSDLIAICERIAHRIDGKLQSYKSKKPQMPSEFGETAAGKWYASLSSATLPESVAAFAKWDAEDERVISELETRLAEKAPADRARELLARKKYVEEIAQWVQDLLQKLSDENCRRILDLKQETLAKREAAKAAASKVFSGAPLDGIGTDTWKLLWEHARQYSELLAYPGKAFPQLDSDAMCVLCQQPLSGDALQRLASFEEFVRGKTEYDARVAERAFADAVTAIGDIPTDQAITTQLDAAGVANEGDGPQVLAFVEVLRQRNAKLVDIDSGDALPGSPEFIAWLDAINLKASEYADAASKSQKDADSDTRPQLQSQRRELRAKRWIFEQRDAVKAEVERLRVVDRLEKAKKLADTRGLSRKKGELAEALVTEAFVQRFRDELKVLGASRIRVELVKKRVDRGRVLHELQLTKSRSGALREVLSEGEHRVVSLAAFLADVTGKQHSAPFVFDDPISSLDQDFEEAVAQRLVRLAAERQVVVFTHRVSLLVLLQEAGRRDGREPNVICIRGEPWGTGEPGDAPLFAKKPEKALNALLHERLARAKKAFAEEGQSVYDPLAKAICCEFRIVLERMIEIDLLADVVQRFRRAINTQGKLDKLARITPEDCRLFDDLMTKYSRYEHSQPSESPVLLPAPDELKTDMETLRDWRAAFVARSF